MKPEKILITGGAGFIGSNVANHLISQGHEVTIYDNLTRACTESNLAWLRQVHGPDSFRLVIANVRDFEILCQAAQGVDRVYHLAGQVAVTTSVLNPRQDFEDNAMGTFNALEAARLSGSNPIFIYSSTNKVYGGLPDLRVAENSTRYELVDMPYGIPESQPLDFHSPYGCSKGAGDQYTRDYARIYGMRSVVVRQSCIYGYRQFGMEDQGWVAWFILAAMGQRPITIYGNGKQVRDILFIDDLIALYDAAVAHIDTAAGQVYNVGGGVKNTISVWAEFGPILEELFHHAIPVKYSDWRPGDQPIYISDIHKAEQHLEWCPRISAKEGIQRLFNWIQDHGSLFKNM